MPRAERTYTTAVQPPAPGVFVFDAKGAPVLMSSQTPEADRIEEARLGPEDPNLKEPIVKSKLRPHAERYQALVECDDYVHSTQCLWKDALTKPAVVTIPSQNPITGHVGQEVRQLATWCALLFRARLRRVSMSTCMHCVLTLQLRSAWTSPPHPARARGGASTAVCRTHCTLKCTQRRGNLQEEPSVRCRLAAGDVCGCMYTAMPACLRCACRSCARQPACLGPNTQLVGLTLRAGMQVQVFRCASWAAPLLCRLSTKAQVASMISGDALAGLIREFANSPTGAQTLWEYGDRCFAEECRHVACAPPGSPLVQTFAN